MSITITNKLIVEEATKLGIENEIISEKHNLVVLKHEGKEDLIRRAVTPITSAVLRYVADHKDATYDVLKHYGFTVPTTYVARSLEDAVQGAGEIEYPLVVKPEDSAYGWGVTVGVTNEEMLKKSYDEAYSINKGDVLIQNFVKGEDHRVMIVDYKVCAVAKRIPCRIFGNGKNTIEELINTENENPKRGHGKNKPMTLIEVDNTMLDFLKLQNMSLGDIPKKDEVVYLRKVANLSTGGEAEDITDKCDGSNKAMFEEMAKVLQASVVGIDVICEDITKPLKEKDYAVIEVNASPGIRMHHHPSKGKPINVAKKIVESLFPNAK